MTSDVFICIAVIIVQYSMKNIFVKKYVRHVYRYLKDL